MTFPRYERYKSTVIDWLAAIPVSWEALRLKRLFEITKMTANEDGHEVLSVTQKGIHIKDLKASQSR
jgi:type I restriction enzyme S subunit